MGGSWLDKLERKLGDCAVERLAYWLVGLKLFGLILLKGSPDAYGQLVFLPERVLAGEWWRLVGLLTIPSTGNVFWLFFELYILFLFVEALEQEWGAFRLNVYYMTAYVLSVSYALIAGLPIESAAYMDRTLMLAFAALFPDFELLLFFILPIRIKWLAVLIWAWVFYSFWVLPPLFKGYLACIYANYLFFFGKAHYASVRAWLRRRQRRG